MYHGLHKKYYAERLFSTSIIIRNGFLNSKSAY